MKYFIIAGEASGDLHGSRLVQALKQKDDKAEVAFWGGDKMTAVAPGGLRKHIRELAFMGFWEVITHLPWIMRNFKLCKRQINEFKPDALILIDYPGFNLRMAKWANKRGCRVFYYISPQVWAWKSGRVSIIARHVEKLFVILPFEAEFYSKRGVDVEYVGHPLVEIIDDYQTGKKFEDRFVGDNKEVIAILPGSRAQEVIGILPRLLRVVPFFPDYRFVVAGLENLGQDVYENAAAGAGIEREIVEFCWDRTYDLLSVSKAALVTSGTATLETALFGCPQVVCYSGSALSFTLAKRLVKVPFISLVNLIAGKRIVEELIQNDLNETRLREALAEILIKENHEQIRRDYERLHEKLAGPGASDTTASMIVSALTTS